MPKYRLTMLCRGVWTLLHPDGYWVGPGLGKFRSPAEAMDWLHAKSKRCPAAV